MLYVAYTNIDWPLPSVHEKTNYLTYCTSLDFIVFLRSLFRHWVKECEFRH